VLPVLCGLGLDGLDLFPLLGDRHGLLRVVESLLCKLDDLGLLEGDLLAIVLKRDGGIILRFVLFLAFLAFGGFFSLGFGLLAFVRFLYAFVGLVIHHFGQVRERVYAFDWLRRRVTCHKSPYCGLNQSEWMIPSAVCADA
jgi:hypothetical protein